MSLPSSFTASSDEDINKQNVSFYNIEHILNKSVVIIF